MRVRDLQRLLESLTPFGATDLDQRTRRLREMRLLPVGGRGLHAPEIGPAHAANVLISLTSPNTPQAHLTVLTYGPLEPGPGSKSAFGGAETFGEALEVILSDPEAKHRVQEVAIIQSWPEARIRFERRGAPTEVVFGGRPEGVQGAARTELILSGGLLSQLALELASPSARTAGGWAADDGYDPAEKRRQMDAAERKERGLK